MHDFAEMRITLQKVKSLFQQLLSILEKEGGIEINYARNELAKDIQVIEVFLSNGMDAAEASEVLSQIKKSYKSMYPPRGGLSEFFVWREDYADRLKANSQLDNIQRELREILGL